MAARPQFQLRGARARACALCLCTLLALACTPAPAALAAGFGGNSTLNKLAESESPESTESTSSTETTKAAAATTSNSGIGGSILVIGVGTAVVLLAGIVFVIMRDVRSVAPVTDTELVEAATSRHSQAVMRKRRAKAKAARQQRKRNR